MNRLKINQDIAEIFIDDITICDEVITFFENYKGSKRVTGSKRSTADHAKGLQEYRTVEVKGRNCVDFSLSVDDVYTQEDLNFFVPFFDFLKKQIQLYEKKTTICHWPVFFLEEFNIQKYVPPHGVYSRLHYEQNFDSELFFRRHYVWCLYLNTVDVGGETFFPKQKVKVKAEKGKLVIFPAHFTHPHKGLKADQVKYIATGWLSAALKGENLDELLHAHRDLNLLSQPRGYFERRPPLFIL